MNMKKRRKKAASSTSGRKKKVVKRETAIPFTAFFAWAVGIGRLQPHQEREIRTFFREHRLEDKEDRDKYLKVLEKY